MRFLNTASVLTGLLLCGVLAGPAHAELITFDDISDNGYGTQISNGYHGLNWNNFYALNTPAYNPSGYQNGTVSFNNVAFNGYGGTADILAASGTFTFTSAYLTGAWNDGLNIQVDGYQAGNLLFTQTVTVDSTSPTLFNFNYANVDDVRFTSSGGTPHGYNGGGEHFAMDNVTVNAAAVPEASSVAGLALMSGAGLLGLKLRRRK